MKDRRNAHKTFVGMPPGERSLGRPGLGNDVVKIYIKNVR
jgi:hypothetical protein